MIYIYTSSAAGSTKMRKEQQAILDYLKSKDMKFEEIDLCAQTDAKDVMRSKIPAEVTKYNDSNKALAPQVFNEDEYCGDYAMFFEAREMELLNTFFKVPPSEKEKGNMKKVDLEAAENKENDPNVGNVVKTEENGLGNDTNQGQKVKAGDNGEKIEDNLKGETDNAEQSAESDKVQQKEESNDVEQKGESSDAGKQKGEINDIEQKGQSDVSDQNGDGAKQESSDAATEKGETGEAEPKREDAKPETGPD
ncbi:SH3 domain-binding glutamic acid-rich protein-like [Styela clava]